MSRDLLASLQAEAGMEGGAATNATPGGDTATATDPSLSADVSGAESAAISDPDLAAHMATYDTIKQQLDTIAHNTEVVRDITKKLKTTANEAIRKQIIVDKDEAIASTTQNGIQIKRTLDAIKTENESMLASSPDVKNTAKMDMRINLYNTYLRKFDGVITESNAAIVGFKSVLEQIEKRQIKVVLPDMSDEKVQEIIDSGKSAEVVQQVLVSDNLQETVRMIEERHDEILKLERQVREIFELFNDLATLVDLQQESLDVISVNISNARRKVEDAEVVLVEARRYQKQARNRKICCCLLVLCIIAVVVVLPTVLKTVADR